MFAQVVAAPSRFHAHQPDRGIGNEGVEKSNRVAAPAHTGDRCIGQAAFRFQNLPARFLADHFVYAFDALERMGSAYPELIGDRFSLLCQLQSYAAAGDPEIGAHVSREFKRLVDEVTRLSGATPREVAQFIAGGMLANVTTILGLPEICAPLWGNEPD